MANKEAHKELFPKNCFTLDVPPLGTIGYFNACSGLELEVDVYQYSEGGNNEQVHYLPGPLKYPYLTLSAGLCEDKAMMTWFEKTWSAAPERVEIMVTLKVPGSQKVRRWSFADAFPVKWVGPNVDSSSNELATESLTIAHAGLKIA